MKKLLILGAISVINEIVIDAKKSGYYVIVTDFYEDSPAKKYADESWKISIDDVDGIVKKCRENHVDGVMNYCVDPGQKPYQQICEKLGLPCVAGFEQFDIMTNKDKFAACCKKYGIGVIPEYSENGELPKEKIKRMKYPVLIKPADGRASKGLIVCDKEENLKASIEYSLSFSKRKKIVVQKYMHCPECIIKYVACDGEFFLTTMSDVYNCIAPDGTRVYMGTQTYPSRFYSEYIKTTNDKVINMLKSIGIKNGAMSLTGFYDNGVFRFFDPSLRMGGAQDWRVACAASGVDISKLLTNFAVTGSMGNVDSISKIDKAFAKKKSALLYFDVRPGTIKKFEGVEDALKVDGVVGYHLCHNVGDTIEKYGTADNVAVRFILSCENIEDLVTAIKSIQAKIVITDENDENMIVSPFDSTCLINDNKG